MERTHTCCQQAAYPAEAINILMEISGVAKRLACNLAKLAEHENGEGGTENEQDGRIGCCCCRAAQMR